MRPSPIDLVVDLIALETGAQGGRDGARDAVAFVPVVEDVQEGEGGVVRDGGRGRGVDQVPGGADVGVGDVEGGVEWFEGVDFDVERMLATKLCRVMLWRVESRGRS